MAREIESAGGTAACDTGEVRSLAGAGVLQSHLRAATASSRPPAVLNKGPVAPHAA